MAGWAEAGSGRWEYRQDEAGADGSRNYLVRKGDTLIEMHVSGAEATFHGYVVGEGVELVPDNPLQRATWRRSIERQLDAAPSSDRAWQLLDEMHAELFGAGGA